MWDLIGSVPDHCLSFYFDDSKLRAVSLHLYKDNLSINIE